MATAATSLLGLALPVTGELSGTWGDTVNVSITALLDTAVAGTTTLSSDADVTLTTTTLAANQARQAIILWTAGGTVTRTITVPAQSKSYIVINKTSSSQSIKIVGVGPTTGVTIVAGTAAFVVWNGVDFVTASVTSTTGILPVANGGTGLSSGTSGGVLAYTASGTLASSAALAASALVIGGGAGAAPSTTTTGTGVVTALGVNTGTAGAFVVNGGALGSPSSVGTMPAFTLGGTVSGGGNQINNVVIGTSGALAGAFTTLSATGDLSFPTVGSKVNFATTSSATVNFVGGSADGFSLEMVMQRGALQPLKYKQDYGVGHIWNVTGSDKMTLSSTALALGVGISLTGGTSGTGYSFSGSAPANSLALDSNGKLDVARSSTNTGAFSEPEIRAINTGAATLNQRVDIGMRFQDGVYNGIGGISMVRESATDNSGSLVLCPIVSGGNSIDAAVINSSGNLGIGTTSPGAKLDISYAGGTSSNTTLGLKIGADVGNNTSRTVNTRKFASIGGANYSNSSSNIGIVYCDSDLTTSVISIGGGSSGVYDATEIRFVTAATTTSTTGSQRMTLDSSGNLLVGTTTLESGSGRITSKASATTTDAIRGLGPNNYTATVYSSTSVTSAGTGWYHFIGQSGNGSAIDTNNIFIFGNGNIQNANNSYGGVSDIKLKENVADATPKLNKLCQVRVVSYNLKGGYEKHKQIGVIAQELEQVFPGMVEETTDRDAEGNDLGTTTKSVKYSVFVPMLIKAIQEQQALITQLTARITALETP